MAAMLKWSQLLFSVLRCLNFGIVAIQYYSMRFCCWWKTLIRKSGERRGVIVKTTDGPDVQIGYGNTIDQFHKYHNAPVPYPTIRPHFCSELCIVGYGTGALWDLWDWLMVTSSVAQLCYVLCNWTCQHSLAKHTEIFDNRNNVLCCK